MIDDRGISFEIALRWMSLDFTDDKCILVQVMAWGHHATSHSLSQCWPRSMPQYGITKPLWINLATECCNCLKILIDTLKCITDLGYQSVVWKYRIKHYMWNWLDVTEIYIFNWLNSLRLKCLKLLQFTPQEHKTWPHNIFSIMICGPFY